jgi:hypothetical protein
MRPIPLEQLLGGPLRALVLAQGIAAQATAQFVSEVGFTVDPRGKNPPSARTIQFTLLRPIPDPENPGQVINTSVVVSAPLLALTSIPNLRIADATVTLNAEVVDVEPTDVRPLGVQIEGRPPEVIPLPPLRFLAAMVTPRIEDGEPSPGGNLSITVKVTREPLAEGLTRVLTILEDALTAEPEAQ